eukprot:218839-Chlamydomonas_euryale.AAC.13
MRLRWHSICHAHASAQVPGSQQPGSQQPGSQQPSSQQPAASQATEQIGSQQAASQVAGDEHATQVGVFSQGKALVVGCKEAVEPGCSD